MKTFGIFHVFVKASINIIVALTMILSQLTWVTNKVAADTPNWSVTMYANLSDNTVTGNNWPLGDVVTLTVHNPSTPPSSDIIMTDTSHPAWWNPNRKVTEFDLEGIIDLQPGLILTMTNGTQIKTLTLVDLTVNPVDPAMAIVSGTAPAGMLVNVGINTKNGASRYATADVNGHWSVDFSVTGTQWDEQTTVNIVGGMAGSADISDAEGDLTSRGWHAIQIKTNPDDFYVRTFNWPLGALLTMTISEPDLNYSAQATVGYDLRGGDKSSDRTFAQFDLPNNRHLLSGDIITITLGAMVKTYTVAPLQVTDIDLQADTISGIATPGVMVHVWTDPETGYFTDRWVTVDGSGHWLANFHVAGVSPSDPGTFDLQAGSNGQASEADDDNNETWVSWNVPLIQLQGFYQPVDMNGVYNIVKGGSTVPLKFEIFAGSTELTDIAYIKSLTYAQISCDANAPTDEIETTATGGTSLRYDTTSGQFIYNWKMPNSAGKCYRVTMATIDGSSLVAYFKLK